MLCRLEKGNNLLLMMRLTPVATLAVSLSLQAEIS